MERYSRQMLFSPIGESGQEKIKQKHVLIVGAALKKSREIRPYFDLIMQSVMFPLQVQLFLFHLTLLALLSLYGIISLLINLLISVK